MTRLDADRWLPADVSASMLCVAHSQSRQMPSLPVLRVPEKAEDLDQDEDEAFAAALIS
ncbi:MAG: hypothetical protein GY926_04130 [bacterium]|nr:hypothetical protein [bacterium]